MSKSNHTFINSNPTFDTIAAKEMDYLYILDSQILGAGKGLHSAILIWKNEIIYLFKGGILSNKEADKRAKKSENKYFINTPYGSIMDSKHVSCFAKFANDSDGIVKSKFNLNSIISQSENNKVCLVAKRDIKAGEEIFCSYGEKYWQNN